MIDLTPFLYGKSGESKLEMSLNESIFLGISDFSEAAKLKGMP